MDSALHLLGIARKAGRAEVGEEPAGAAGRARPARALRAAADAADNSIRRAARFAEAGQIPWLKTPWDKGTLGGAVGRTACAMLALTDAGLAAALVEKLAQADPDAYGPAAEALRDKADRQLQRQREQRVHEKKLERAKKKPWAPPPAGHGDPARRAAPKNRGPGKKKKRTP